MRDLPSSSSDVRGSTYALPAYVYSEFVVRNESNTRAGADTWRSGWPILKIA